MKNNKIKELRTEKGVTQIEISKILGITNDYFSMIERGERSPGFKLSKKIADYFNTTIDEIFFTN